MKPNGIITLTSDFCTVDGFAGAVKGKILSIFPRATIIDISHEIPVGDVETAAWCLLTSTRFFPGGTVHIAVVDPGVGSGRRPLILEGGNGQFYVGPDNGIFDLASAQDSLVSAWEIDLSKAEGELSVSNTFHGRDIFAPAAARLAKGISIKKFAKKTGLEDIKKLEIDFSYEISGGKIKGKVLHIDRFGNIITSIPSKYSVVISRGEIKEKAVKKPVHCYNDITRGELNFIEGSGGFIEISANGASASGMAGAMRGGAVTAYLKRRH